MGLRSVVAIPCLLLAVCACVAPGKREAELSPAQICMSHYEHDPVLQGRCNVDPNLRGETPPDVRPMDLPIRNGQIGD